MHHLHKELNMNTQRTQQDWITHLHHRAAMVDAAKARAQQLRSAAYRDAWRDLNGLLVDGGAAAGRSAQRLVASLARHRHLRTQAAK